MKSIFKNTIKSGSNLTKISFAIGTTFLLAYLITNSLYIALLGYYYLFIAFIINFVFALILLVKAQSKIQEKRKYYKTVVLMLINIPIAYVYFLIVAKTL